MLDVLLKNSSSEGSIDTFGSGILAHSDKRLCVVAAIREYIRGTKDRGTETQLFISHQKPHGPVSKSTVARRIRDVLHRVGVDHRHRIIFLYGVDTSQFGAHSTRQFCQHFSGRCQGHSNEHYTEGSKVVR